MVLYLQIILMIQINGWLENNARIRSLVITILNRVMEQGHLLIKETMKSTEQQVRRVISAKTSSLRIVNAEEEEINYMKQNGLRDINKWWRR